MGVGETIDAWLEGTGEAGKQLKLRPIFGRALVRFPILEVEKKL